MTGQLIVANVRDFKLLRGVGAKLFTTYLFLLKYKQSALRNWFVHSESYLHSHVPHWRRKTESRCFEVDTMMGLLGFWNDHLIIILFEFSCTCLKVNDDRFEMLCNGNSIWLYYMHPLSWLFSNTRRKIFVSLYIIWVLHKLSFNCKSQNQTTTTLLLISTLPTSWISKFLIPIPLVQQASFKSIFRRHLFDLQPFIAD